MAERIPITVYVDILELKRLLGLEEPAKESEGEVPVFKPRKKTTLNTFVLPSGIDPEVWKAFKEHRDRNRKPMTTYAMNRMCAKLVEVAGGGDMNLPLLQSIDRGWTDVYPVHQGYRPPGSYVPTRQDLIAMLEEPRQ